VQIRVTLVNASVLKSYHIPLKSNRCSAKDLYVTGR